MFEIVVCEKDPKPKTRGKSIKTLRKIHELSKHIIDSTQEHVIIISVDVKYKLIAARIINIGNNNATYISTPDVFRFVLNDNAYAFYVVHNHPFGGLKASKADKKMSDKLYNIASSLNICLIDSIIVSSKGAKSIFTGKKIRCEK